jgi:glycosyltransferase involved in cell wall biosynthesis/GT2 family glycosyltransferase
VTSVSAVIPVKDGERYLEELLGALVREGVDEVLVIDSGSTDRSVEIARSVGVDIIEVAPMAFGHGRTRNLAAESTSGDLICFLTQDATPVVGWLSAYLEAFSLDKQVGAAFGPHLPRPGTSPMIARELEEFFAGFSPDGRPVVQSVGDATFLSNVNACYARGCWQQVRFREVWYSEDQAFGADLLRAGWTKVYHPRAAVLHAHDYGFAEFMRRYFDEYRGLHGATGHIERFGLRATVRVARAHVAADRQWMRQRGMDTRETLGWTMRSAAHHGGRQFFAALGSRAHRFPAPVQELLSLERRPGGSPSSSEPRGEPECLLRGPHVEPTARHEPYGAAAEVWREGPTPLLEPVPGMAERRRLRVAMIVPPFTRGSGGHNTLFQILSRLESNGHVCSVWLSDYLGELRGVRDAVLRHDVREFFARIEAPVYNGFRAWHGADVVVATGWQTVHPALRLGRSYARVYLVNDHEPEFYSTSAERLLAEDTYRHGLHCIAATPWLRDLLSSRYGATADAFQLGVDHDTYRPRPVTRRCDTVVYYARHETPRRAVPIGLMALAELHRRRPGTRIVLFGSESPLSPSFPYEHMGILSPRQLSWLYSEATAGLCLSLTNFSLMPKEMLACGLPCVELAGVSAESVFGADGPLQLTPANPDSIAAALGRLLDDRALWERRSRAGIAFVRTHTWSRAAHEVEAGLRQALRLRGTEDPQRA